MSKLSDKEVGRSADAHNLVDNATGWTIASCGLGLLQVEIRVRIVRSHGNPIATKNKIGTSSLHWFGRGMVGGLMLVAAANAASYFFRSQGFSQIFGSPDGSDYEAVGFPFEIWQAGNSYGGWMIDYSVLPWNLLTGLIVGTICGLVGVAGKSRFNQWVAEFESSEESRRQVRLQFSVKGLLILTTIIALLFAATTTWGSSPQLLGAIYLLGPLCLILIAMAPDQIPWEARAVILVIVAVAMIGIAITTGSKLGLTFDQVMFGIFVCWTPQSVFAAFFIVVGLIFQSWRTPPQMTGD